MYMLHCWFVDCFKVWLAVSMFACLSLLRCWCLGGVCFVFWWCVGLFGWVLIVCWVWLVGVVWVVGVVLFGCFGCGCLFSGWMGSIGLLF